MKVFLDPFVARGLPAVKKTSTSVIADRFNKGELAETLASDYRCHLYDIKEAILFEGLLRFDD